MLNSHIKTNFNTYTSNHRVKTSCNSNPIASFVIEARLGLHSCHIIRNIKGIQLLMRNPPRANQNEQAPSAKFPFATDILDIDYLSHKRNFCVNGDKKDNLCFVLVVIHQENSSWIQNFSLNRKEVYMEKCFKNTAVKTKQETNFAVNIPMQNNYGWMYTHTEQNM